MEAPEAGDAPRAVEALEAGGELTEATLREELRNRLDLNGVPGELIEGWAASEARAPLLSRKGAEHLPGQVREVSMHFLKSIADAVGLPQSGWLDASLLLDAYHLSLPAGELCMGSLPAACVAIVGLLMKSGSATVPFKPAGLTGAASQFLRWLGDRGYAEEASVTTEEVSRQELVVLRALGWRVNRPSVFTWLKVLCERFDIMSTGVLTENLNWVHHQSLIIAETLVLRNMPLGPMAPRRMANGLFCLLLARAQLLPASDLRPEDLEAAKWEELFCQSQCLGSLPEPLVPEAHWAEMANLLRMAACCEGGDLRADAHAVAEAMVSVARSIRQGAQGNGE